MKISSFSIAFLSAAAAVALLAGTASATEPAKAEKPKATTAIPGLTYKVPLRGAPKTRVGGGTRSADAPTMTLRVLAPDHTGYTLADKPTIYWYVSEPITHPIEATVTLVEAVDDALDPVLEFTLAPPIKAGIHALRLEDHGISLKPDVEYEWFVAVVTNPDQRSGDILAGGSIKRIAAPAAVETKLREAGEAMRTAVYAESGIWYDAIDQISRLIGADPSNRALREQRALLLEQVGLSDAAAYDRRG